MLSFFAIPELRFIIANFKEEYFEGSSLTWKGWEFISYCLYFSLISIMFILNCFRDKLPRNSTYPKSGNPSPELHVGVLDRISFHWWTKMAWLGFMRPLNENDMYDSNPDDVCSELFPPFDKYFKESIEKNKK